MMNSYNGFILSAVVFSLVCLSSSSEMNDSKELISNPEFRSSESDTIPANWSIWHPRWEAAKCNIRT